MLSKLRSLLICTTALSLALAARSQTFSSGYVLSVVGNPTLMATGDLNKDGIPDLVYQDNYNSGNLHIMLGNSSGTFTVGQVIAVPVDAGSVITLADLKGDGNLDIILGNNGSNDGVGATPGIVSVFLGNGDGTFKPIITSPAQTESVYTQIIYRIAIADFDGDGYPDLIFGDGYQYLYFMKGDGQGHLGPATQIASGFGDLYVADLNGDGIPDLINGTLTNGFAVLLGHGHAAFAAPISYPLHADTVGQGTFALADLDGDGQLDVLSGGYGGLYVNYGHADGTFDPLVTIANPTNNNPSILGISDLNGDGQPRIFISSFDGVTVALGATPGGFHMYAGTGQLSSQSVIGDFNGDGYTDVAIPGDNSIVFLYGNPDGTLIAGDSFPAGNEVGGLVMVDVDGDGFPDAVLSPDLLHHGNGDGTFDPSILGGAMYGGSTTYVYTGDFDGDGIPDLFTFTDAYFGLGNGTFTEKGTIYPDGFATNYSVVGDFNQDGLSDIATSYNGYSYNVGVALAGAGRTFSPVIIPFTESPGPLGSADFNGDHCPDLAVAGQTQIYILEGDCTGNFKQTASYLTGYSGDPADVGVSVSFLPSDLAIADLDGDGFPDIVYVIPAANLARVLYGTATGALTEGADIPLPHPSLFVTIGDLDGDGRPDLVFAGHNLITVMHGQPNRTFGSVEYLAGGFETGKPVLADLRQIGRLDISVPNYGIEGHGANDVGVTYAVLLNSKPGVIVSGVAAKLTSSPNPSTPAQPFTINAILTPPTGGTTLTGTVAFSIDGTSLGSASVANNVATIPGPATLTVGAHKLSATWSGDATYASLTLTGTHTVSALPLTLILGSDINPSALNQTVTFATAFVATPTPSDSTLTGTLSFYDGTTLLAQQQPSTAGDAFAISTLIVGTHPITAVYSGDANFATATSNIVQQVVNALPTTTTVAVSPNPSTYGQLVTFSAHVAPVTTNKLVPTGQVVLTFCRGATITLALDASGNGSASTQIPEPVSSCVFTGQYSGDTNFDPSTSASVTYVVNPAPSTTTLTATPNPAYVSQPVTFTLLVTGMSSPGVDPITGKPITRGPLYFSGTVQLFDGTAALTPPEPVTTTSATTAQTVITVSTLTAGSHIITATYSNDPNLGSSTSAPVTEVILASDFTFAGPASITFRTQATGTGLLTLGSLYGFAGPVVITCNPPFPPNYLCTLSPATATLTANGGTSSTISLHPDVHSSIAPQSSPRIILATLFPLTLLALILSKRGRRRLNALLLLALMTMVTTALTACGPDIFYGATPPGTYPLTVTATGTAQGASVRITHTLPLNVVITP